MRGSFFFSHLHSTSKRVGVYPKTSFNIHLTGGGRSMVAFDINGVHGRVSRCRSERVVVGVPAEENMIDCRDG